MSFDEIEGLTTNQLRELYEDVIDADGNFIISEVGTIFYVECTNGRKGYYPKSGRTNAINYVWTGSNGSTTNAVCGTGENGTATAIAHFDTSSSNIYGTNGTLFYVECENGNRGYYPKDGQYSNIGYVWRAANGDTTGYVCGKNVYGVSTAYAHY